MNKEPMMETELFRMWKGEKNEFKELGDKGIKIKYKGKEYSLLGFTHTTDKNENVIFAYKFKHDQRMITYFVAEGEEHNETIEIALQLLEHGSQRINYTLANMRETLDSVCVELDNMEEKDERNKSKSKHRKTG